MLTFFWKCGLRKHCKKVFNLLKKVLKYLKIWVKIEKFFMLFITGKNFRILIVIWFPMYLLRKQAS